VSLPPTRIVARTKSVDETRSLAGTVAQVVVPGDLFLLAGDLGAGKTAFVQGFGRALGVTEPITSPTFTLAQRYDGRLVIHHMDVYRLEQLHEVLDLGFGELLDDGGVVMVEWGDAVLPVMPRDYLEVRLGFTDDEDDDARSVTVRPVGPRWSARWPAVLDAVSPWVVEVTNGSGGDLGADPDGFGGGAC
jgi:tRNA threonylcarbamoyladenosine biosynthesis protein TsaE